MYGKPSFKISMEFLLEVVKMFKNEEMRSRSRSAQIAEIEIISEF
jgi:hypothetical protein